MTNSTFFSALASFLLVCSSALADSYSVALNPVIQPDPRGVYLSAPFDFGVEFSHIDSATLSFLMPAGYEGGGFTTGNSSSWRELVVVVHDRSLPLTDITDLNSPTALSNFATKISPGTNADLDFRYLSVALSGEPLPDPVWPAFLLMGRGSVSWIDRDDGFLTSLIPGIASYETEFWSNPGEVGLARLTIEGTAVPEPNAMMLMLGAVAVVAMTVRRGTN